MRKPDLDRIVETFVPIAINPDATAIQVWQDYLDLLRTQVSPLVRQLADSGTVEWYSFLVHGRQSGVPTDESDQGYYVHLRLELADGVQEHDLASQLPPFCKMTRKMPVPQRDRLNNNDVQAFKEQNVEWGWHVLGEGSEWILRMLESHDPNVRIPPQNVAQLLHYVGNSLLTRTVGIPMP